VESTGHLFVEGHFPGHTVDHEQHHGGILECDLDLFLDAGIEHIVRVRPVHQGKPTSVDQFEGVAIVTDLGR